MQHHSSLHISKLELRSLIDCQWSCVTGATHSWIKWPLASGAYLSYRILGTSRCCRAHRQWYRYIMHDTLPSLSVKWRQASIAQWNEMWTSNRKGSWTHRIFRTAQNRVKLAHTPNFWISQAIGGHGMHGAYLYTRKRRLTPVRCCGHNVKTAEHIFKECLLYDSGRPTRDPVAFENIKYVKRTITHLWILENPNFAKRRSGIC